MVEPLWHPGGLVLPPVIGSDQITDPGAHRTIQGLINLVEEWVAKTGILRAENQRLPDEIAHLQGE